MTTPSAFTHDLRLIRFVNIMHLCKSLTVEWQKTPYPRMDSLIWHWSIYDLRNKTPISEDAFAHLLILHLRFARLIHHLRGWILVFLIITFAIYANTPHIRGWNIAFLIITFAICDNRTHFRRLNLAHYKYHLRFAHYTYHLNHPIIDPWLHILII